MCLSFRPKRTKKGKSANPTSKMGPNPSGQQISWDTIQDEDFQNLVQAINSFGFRLQNASDPELPSPAFCFPNIYHCLLLLSAGSQNTNLDVLAKALGFSAATGGKSTNSRNLESVLSCFQTLDNYMRSASATEILTAASVWYARSIELEPSYVEQITTLFSAKLGRLSASDINEFTKEATKGKITTQYTDESLRLIDIMLLTCLYFKADWADPFDRDMTIEYQFQELSGNGSKPCKMMQLFQKTYYTEDETMQMCQLPYSAGETSNSPAPRWQAAVILPKKSGQEGIATVLNQLETQSFGALIESTSKYMLELKLPRFKFEVSQSLNTKLKALGLNPLFSLSNDFAPLTKSTALQVSLVTHDFFIEVNEEGTEVAATTTVVLTRSMPMPVENRTMVVDRPFLFVVYDSQTQLVLCSTVITKVPGE